MVHECQHIYETGRKCRRIPKRGESLCPGHRPRSDGSFHDEPDFARRLLGYAQQLRGVSFETLLRAVQDDLAAIQPIVERKSSRAAYTPFARAIVAVAVALEQMNALRAAARDPSSRPAPASQASAASRVSYASHR